MNQRVLARPRRAQRSWRVRLVLAMLARLQRGTLELELPDGTFERFGGAPGTLAPASIRIHDWAVFRAVIASGDIGFAEGYLQGQWDTPDLAALLTLFAANRDSIEQAVYGSVFGGLLNRLRHWRNDNSRTGSRRNIAAHYDLGNAFYALWLDPSMTYSSAIFGADPARSLEAAQAAKYDRILARLAPAPGARILEIGCGWGGFAERAARLGARVHGISLSREQLAFARTRVARAGVADRVELDYLDYRDVRGTYDYIVSIEMIEAVGERYWPQYFEAIRRLLQPGGRALVQAITIADRLFDRYRVGTDFIQRYIFPGGMLPSPSRFRAEAERAGLAVRDVFPFGPDYAETLRRWRAAFESAHDPVAAQGFDERFQRMWRFYLAYCEAAFVTGCTDVIQAELE